MKRLLLARVMLLALFRDVGALTMAFIMPPVVFFIFALMFARAGGADIQVGIAVADLAKTPISERIIRGLEKASSLRIIRPVLDEREPVEVLLRRGEADAGLVIGESTEADLLPPLLVLVSPSREIAGVVLEGTVQEILLAEAADVGMILPIRREAIGPAQLISASIPYYAAAVSLLFLLLSAMQGALSLQEERESGLFERVSSGPGGIAPIIEGKFLFLTVQGIIQVCLIFLAAVLVFGVSLEGVILPWLATTALCAAAAAGLGLFFVTLCRTRRQAMTLGNILVLLLSALGGSMIPRFFMPVEMQTLGWVTPNTWGLEAYATFLWRGDELEAVLVPWTLMAGAAMIGVLGARFMARRWT